MNIQEIIEAEICEQMTGCDNAGRFRDYARSQGYEFVEVVDWTSSAGDWSFIVSKDGEEWHPMSQENNWPRQGFTRSIDTSAVHYGTASDVLNEIAEMYY